MPDPFLGRNAIEMFVLSITPAHAQAFLHPSAGEFNNYRLSWMGLISFFS
jgi:hypothetical protein